MFLWHLLANWFQKKLGVLLGALAKLPRADPKLQEQTKWKKSLLKLEKNESRIGYHVWIQQSRILLENHLDVCLVLLVSSAFMISKRWLLRHTTNSEIILDVAGEPGGGVKDAAARTAKSYGYRLCGGCFMSFVPWWRRLLPRSSFLEYFSTYPSMLG